jgi:hypothetical protein
MSDTKSAAAPGRICEEMSNRPLQPRHGRSRKMINSALRRPQAKVSPKSQSVCVAAKKNLAPGSKARN